MINIPCIFTFSENIITFLPLKFFYCSSNTLNIPKINNNNYKLNSRKYSNGKNKLDPNWITGYTDGEASFIISIQRNPSYKIGWRVKARFSICVHKKDIMILELIKNYIGGVGIIYKHKDNSVQYQVNKLEELIDIIIPHFDKYPLITQKKGDFLLFKLAVDLMKCKKHLTIEGLNELLAIRASINLGLSVELKTAFPEIIPVQRTFILDQKILNPNWLAGFTSGEWCFSIDMAKSSTTITGTRVQLLFKIGQEIRDEQLIKSFVSYFGCGRYFPRKDFGEFIVTKFKDITEKIIPFFDKYKIIGVKSQDYADFKKVGILMENKAHLTPEGLDQIRKIKNGMNKGRI